MNRRDLLKMLGIGGVGAVANVVSGKEVEAAEIPVAKPVIAEPGSVTSWPRADVSALSGTACVWIPERSYFGGRQSWEYMHGTALPDYDFGGDE